MSGLLTAMIIMGLIALVSLAVIILMWRLMPESSFASYEGQHWKLGGAFAAFVLVYFGAVYMFKDIIVPVVNDASEREKQEERQKPTISAEVIWPPNDQARYQDLFADLDRNTPFIAYNPPFFVEERGSKKFWKKSLEIHRERYENGVHSRYLFFSPDSYERAMAFFDVLRTKVKERVFAENIEIEEMTEEGPPSCNSFFLAIKNGKKVVIFYPDPYSTNKKPERVIKLVGANDLYDKYKIIFEQEFARAKKLREQKGDSERLRGY